MEPERIELSARERERLKVLQEVEEGHLKQVEAAERLRLTDRHVRRLQVRLRREGDGASCIACAAAARIGRSPRRSSGEPSVSCARGAMPALVPPWPVNIWPRKM